MHSWDRTGPLVHSDHSGFLSISRWENTLDYLGSSLGPICSSFPACTPPPWTGVERRKPASFSSSPRGSPAALEHPISLNPSFFPYCVTTEEAEACQALPTPPKVRVLSRFHLWKGGPPSGLWGHLLWLWARESLGCYPCLYSLCLLGQPCTFFRPSICLRLDS